LIDGESRRGPTEFFRFIHLRCEDIVGQALSWCRAEPTDFWQHGDLAHRRPGQDLDWATELVHSIRDHNDAWTVWFDQLGVHPDPVSYEQVVQDRRAAVEGIAAHLDVEMPKHWQPSPRSIGKPMTSTLAGPLRCGCERPPSRRRAIERAIMIRIDLVLPAVHSIARAPCAQGCSADALSRERSCQNIATATKQPERWPGTRRRRPVDVIIHAKVVSAQAGIHLDLNDRSPG
jgi:hypothetical protein